MSCQDPGCVRTAKGTEHTAACYDSIMQECNPLHALLDRVIKAANTLERAKDAHWEEIERTRLSGKIEGINLVRSYIEEALR